MTLSQPISAEFYWWDLGIGYIKILQVSDSGVEPGLRMTELKQAICSICLDQPTSMLQAFLFCIFRLSNFHNFFNEP